MSIVAGLVGILVGNEDFMKKIYESIMPLILGVIFLKAYWEIKTKGKLKS